jgi:predicted O-linked N-acetylglucosamine transferase (SPINDLY family)
MTSLPQLLAAAWQHYQAGRSNDAIDCLTAAIRLEPDVPEPHNNLGALLAEKGRLAEAVASFREAIRLKPDYPEAQKNLANALRGQAQVHFKRGLTLAQQGKYEEAAASYQQALHFQPDSAGAHNNLGNVFLRQGKLAEATESFRQAVRSEPEFAAARSNLGEALHQQGNALVQQGNLNEAVIHLVEAVRLKPDYVEAICSLGVAFWKQGLPDAALEQYQRGLRIDPGHAATLLNLGALLQERGELALAEATLQRALDARPDSVDASYNLALVLQHQGRVDEAETLYREVIRRKPQYVDAHLNLGAVLKDQGRLDDALEAFRTALGINPDAVLIHSNLVYTLNFHSGYDGKAIREACARWNQQHAEPLRQLIRPHHNTPDPERQLKIGYVSPDFREHVGSFFTIPLLSNHDHQRYLVFCYANVAYPDAMTKRLQTYADRWRSTVRMSDQEIALLVQSDQIDILVDLAVHTANNELLVFARKPAPVQVTWLGYPGTTGLSTMDYRFTDPYIDPPGLYDDCYSEESVRLPDCFWCYEPLSGQTPVASLPALENGVITFGCLNTFCKVNEGCLSLWAQVLREVPRSRLLLVAPKGRARVHVAAQFRQDGISESRIEFVDRVPRLEYLHLHDRIDLALDPFPYNGGTTTLEAFWMGVPTITLLGKTAVGRGSWSQLCNLGLQELAATTPEEYVALAARWANDLRRLEELRVTLRQRMRQSPLMDGKRFARHVEEAYRHMWRRWCEQPGSARAN